MSKVDFFIVGAPKCGTTALAQVLAQNPNIVISDPKEPHYFCTDLNTGDCRLANDGEYHHRYFPKQKADDTLWGDASVWHMYSEVALRKIFAYNPNAKIIVMIRDPARGAFSLHQQMIFQNQEDCFNFPEAWKRSDSRFDRDAYPKNMTVDSRLVAYRHAYSYHGQLKRVFRYFPPAHVLILQQEMLNQSGIELFIKVTEFLGGQRYDYKVTRTNETLYINNRVVVGVLRSHLFKNVTFALKKWLGIASFGVGRPSERFTDEYRLIVEADLSQDILAIKEDFGIEIFSKSK